MKKSLENTIRNVVLKKPLTEAEIPAGMDDTPDEIRMVKTELRAIAAKASDLANKMPEDMHVEPWIQAKIADAKGMIGSVHDHMMYGEHSSDSPAAKRSKK
jgi:hypothetical protein